MFSRGAFEALADDIEDVETSESENEQPVSPEKPKAAPLSKAAKKRAARAARDSVQISEDVKSGSKQAAEYAVNQAKEVVDGVVNGAPQVTKLANEFVGGTTEAAKETIKVVKESDALAAGNEYALAAAATVQNAAASASEAVNGAVKAASGTAQKITEAVGKVSADATGTVNGAARTAFTDAKKAVQAVDANGRRPVPSSLPFKPSLPTLPQAANDLLANRKRGTPPDFTSHSPSKEVKFQDGLAPGEGKAGERIIAGVGRHAIVEPKNRNAVERTIWTFIMIFGFILLLCMGHPYMILLVMLCQTLVYKEVTALFELSRSGSNDARSGDRWSKTLNWYFFVVTNYLLYGESIIYYFKHIVFVDAYFLPFAKNHRFISFMLYVVGFVGFVANLQKQYLRQQFALFCWVHMSLLVIVVSSHFIINNILEGLIWFFVPASLVICNDVMAYICGKAFGRTPLIKLSPKKTVEGFVGAFICTLIFGLAWSTFFMRFNYMICPARDLGTNVFSNVQCKLNPVFVWRTHTVAGPLRAILPSTISYAPFQIHSLFMATFASLVAPFGGFFASGFKRAFNIKDFGHSIPGHGGMTDRMDCQFLMGLFSYVYYSSLVRVQYATVGSVLQTIVTALDVNEQLELLADLRRYLDGQGVKN